MSTPAPKTTPVSTSSKGQKTATASKKMPPPPSSASQRQRSISSASSGPTNNLYRTPTAASAAKAAASSSIPAAKAAGPVLSAPKKNPSSSQVAAEAVKLEAEEIYSTYLQSEFVRLTALENLRKAKQAADNESTIMWTSVATKQNEVANQEIVEDDLLFLRNFASERSQQCEVLDKVVLRLPSTVERLKRLAEALERSQNFLQLSAGVDVSGGDLDKIRSLFEKKRACFESAARLMEGDQSQDMSSTVRKLRGDMSVAVKCYERCQQLVQQLEEESIREASLKLSAEERPMKQITLEIPPAVALPKLIDF